MARYQWVMPPRPRGLHAWAVLALSIGLAACSDAAGPATTLAENRARWRALGVSDYGFRFHRMCFCEPPALEPVRIRVSRGAVVAVYDSLGQAIDSLGVALHFTVTIDSLFGVVDHAIAMGAARLDVRYHPSFGYPERIAIDYFGDAVDDEIGLEADSLILFRIEVRR